MSTLTNVELKVEGMSCEHCVNAVSNAVKAFPGVENVAVSLEAKNVTFAYDPGQSGLDQIKQGIEDQGFDVL